MLKIKDFKIISGLEGNATDGWYIYSNVSQYTATIQVDVETDVANAVGVVRISELYLSYYINTITQQSQSVSSTNDGVQIIASYLIDRSEVINSGSLIERYYPGIAEIGITVTDSTNTDTINKELYGFVPHSIISFCCMSMKNYPVEYINNKVTKCFTGPNVYTELTILFDPASNYSIEDCKYKLYNCYDLRVEGNYDEITNQIIGPIIYQKKIREGHYIVGAMIYNINDTLYNYERNDVTFGCITSALNDFSDPGYTDNNNDMIIEYLYNAYSSLRNQIDEPTIYFSTGNTVSIVGSASSIFTPTSLTSNTDTLHVWGNIIANNITDATSRLTAAQATLTTLSDMFTVETVVTGTYTTKAANTLEDTGITFGNLEYGAIYAIYGSNTNGRVADLRIRAENSTSNINFYEYCLNSSTRMNLALPVFYCYANKGSAYGDYHLWVSRTATGSNTYTIYKVLGPLL